MLDVKTDEKEPSSHLGNLGEVMEDINLQPTVVESSRSVFFENDASYHQLDQAAGDNFELDPENVTTNDQISDEGDSDSNSRREILCAILRALMLVDQMNGSHNDISDALELAKDLYCGDDSNLKKLWPKTWKETEKLLKENGYKEPRELYVCLDNSHYSQWDVMDDPNATCRFCGNKGAIKYYYLGLPDKIKRWFSDPVMCDKMLGHWKEKEHWISGIGANFTLKELWDGGRFNELSYFWDPQKEWMLPCKCSFCNSIFSADEIRQSPEVNGLFCLLCDECGTRQMHCPKYAHGNPCNLALIGHWDGWSPFGVRGKNCCGMSDECFSFLNECLKRFYHIYICCFLENINSSSESVGENRR